MTDAPEPAPRPAVVPAAPPGTATVTSWLVSPDAAALLTFLADVFGAVEVGRVPGPDGRIGHAETRLGDATLITFDARPGWPAAPAYLRVYVDDLAATLARAAEHGARLVTEPTPLVFGDVAARIADPWDNLWWVHEHVADVEVTEMLRRLADPETQAAMAAFEQSLDDELRRRAGPR